MEKTMGILACIALILFVAMLFAMFFIAIYKELAYPELQCECEQVQELTILEEIE